MLLSFFDLLNLAVAKSGLSCGSVCASEMQSHLWAAGGARGVQAEPFFPAANWRSFPSWGMLGRSISVVEALVRGSSWVPGSRCGSHL